MEQDAVKCARFILSLHNDGYYVDKETLSAAKNIMDDYVYENDCTDDIDDGFQEGLDDGDYDTIF